MNRMHYWKNVRKQRENRFRRLERVNFSGRIENLHFIIHQKNSKGSLTIIYLMMTGFIGGMVRTRLESLRLWNNG